MSVSYKPKNRLVRIIGFGLIVVILLITIILADTLLGFIGDTGQIRENSRKFREEVAFLKTRTLNIVPSTNHSYPREHRSSADVNLKDDSRLFRSDQSGLILSAGKTIDAKTRILFLGGSTTETNEVDEPYRFPSVVQKLLRKAGLDVATMNAGVRGHTTQDSINALINRKEFREANIIVLNHNINDRLVLALRGHYGAKLGVDAATSWETVGLSARGLFNALWDFVSYRSNALFLVRSRAEQFNPWTGEAPPDKEKNHGIVVTEKAIDFDKNAISDTRMKFEQNLRLFVNIVRTLGKHPVLMTQPLGVASYSQAQFNDVIRTISKKLDVLIIDLDSSLPSNRSWAFLSDNIHLNNPGSNAIGHMIAKDLAALLGSYVEYQGLNIGAQRVDELLSKCRGADERIQIDPTITSIGVSGRYPSFSANGRWLLFQRWETGRNRLKALDLQNNKLIELSPSNGYDGERHPAFLTVGPNEFEIVFGSGFIENKKAFERLMVRHWPSLQTRKLLPDPDLGGAIPSVKQDEVVFAGFRRSRPDNMPDLYRFNTSSEEVSRLTNTPWEEWRPVIAPNNSVYFIANQNKNFDIFSLPLSGGEPKVVIGNEKDEWDPAVSPDGKWLAFASHRENSWDVYISPTNKMSASKKITGLPGDEWDPAWHPAGSLLVFASKQTEESRIAGVCPFGLKESF